VQRQVQRKRYSPAERAVRRAEKEKALAAAAAARKLNLKRRRKARRMRARLRAKQGDTLSESEKQRKPHPSWPARAWLADTHAAVRQQAVHHVIAGISGARTQHGSKFALRYRSVRAPQASCTVPGQGLGPASAFGYLHNDGILPHRLRNRCYRLLDTSISKLREVRLIRQRTGGKGAYYASLPMTRAELIRRRQARAEACKAAKAQRRPAAVKMPTHDVLLASSQSSQDTPSAASPQPPPPAALPTPSLSQCQPSPSRRVESPARKRKVKRPLRVAVIDPGVRCGWSVYDVRSSRFLCFAVGDARLAFTV
jgi:hypothetical protein